MFEPNICPICGKEFWPTAYWSYKYRIGERSIKCCSWHCLRVKQKADEEEERKQKEAEKKGRKCKQIEQLSPEGEVVAVYGSATDAGDAFYDSSANIYSAIRQKTKYKGFYWRYKQDDVSQVQK